MAERKAKIIDTSQFLDLKGEKALNSDIGEPSQPRTHFWDLALLDRSMRYASPDRVKGIYKEVIALLSGRTQERKLSFAGEPFQQTGRIFGVSELLDTGLISNVEDLQKGSASRNAALKRLADSFYNAGILVRLTDPKLGRMLHPDAFRYDVKSPLVSGSDWLYRQTLAFQIHLGGELGYRASVAGALQCARKGFLIIPMAEMWVSPNPQSSDEAVWVTSSDVSAAKRVSQEEYPWELNQGDVFIGRSELQNIHPFSKVVEQFRIRNSLFSPNVQSMQVDRANSKLYTKRDL